MQIVEYRTGTSIHLKEEENKTLCGLDIKENCKVSEKINTSEEKKYCFHCTSEFYGSIRSNEFSITKRKLFIIKDKDNGQGT